MISPASSPVIPKDKLSLASNTALSVSSSYVPYLGEIYISFNSKTFCTTIKATLFSVLLSPYVINLEKLIKGFDVDSSERKYELNSCCCEFVL